VTIPVAKVTESISHWRSKRCLKIEEREDIDNLHHIVGAD